MVPQQVRTCIDRAVRIAQAKRAVTCVIIPNDLQEVAYVDPPVAHGATHTGVGYPGASTLPGMDDLKKAAEILNKGKKIAMLVGAGALHATDEVIAVANRLNAGVAKALLGKAVAPDDLPFVTGSLGLLGTKPSWDLMKECDTLLMVGSAFPYNEFLPKPGNARGVQIDIDGANISLRYPMDYSLLGDSKQTLTALLPLLEQNANVEWRKSIEKGVAQCGVGPSGDHEHARGSQRSAAAPPITIKDAKNFMTMMKDEPELASVIKNSRRQILAGILPSKD
jgi:pyruvate dehydrogenase (quinone)